MGHRVLRDPAHMTRRHVVEPLDVKKLAYMAQLVPGPVGEIIVQKVSADEPVVESTVGKHHVTATAPRMFEGICFSCESPEAVLPPSAEVRRSPHPDMTI